MQSRQRVRLTREFRAKVLQARERGMRATILARHAGYPHSTAFCAALNAGEVIASHKNLDRLHAVAAIVGHEGAVVESLVTRRTPAESLIELVRRRLNRDVDGADGGLAVTRYPGGHVVTLGEPPSFTILRLSADHAVLFARWEARTRQLRSHRVRDGAILSALTVVIEAQA